jgi:hypothetical protein
MTSVSTGEFEARLPIATSAAEPQYNTSNITTELTTVRRVSQTPPATTQLEKPIGSSKLDLSGEKVTIHDVRKALELPNNITYLNISACEHIKAGDISKIPGALFKKLETISISNTGATFQDLKYVLEHAKNATIINAACGNLKVEELKTLPLANRQKLRGFLKNPDYGAIIRSHSDPRPLFYNLGKDLD